MPRRAKGLTAAFVDKVTKPGRYGDGDGLYLKVRSRHAKFYEGQYTSPVTGKVRTKGLGPKRRVSLADARVLNKQVQAMVHAGKDPLEEEEAEKAKAKADAAKAKAAAITFAQVAYMYIAAHEGSWRSSRHRQQWISTMRDYVLPVIGDMPVAGVTTPEVMRILEPLWRDKTETAARVRGRIEAVLDYAKARGWRGAENCARWKGHLANLLPPRRKAQRVVHLEALPWRETGAFMQRLWQDTSIGARCLQFLILTACRSGEARGARWSEIDLKQKLWTVPEQRIKSGRTQRVPLSEPALAVLDEMAQLGTEGFVFPGLKASTVSGRTLMRAMDAAGGNGATVHGFRSTFRDWAAEATAYPRELAEAALAHVVENKTEAAYQRGDLLERRRRLMNEWGVFCGRPMVAGEVLPFQRPA